MQYSWQQDEQQSLLVVQEFCRHRLANNLRVLDADDELVAQIKSKHGCMRKYTSLNLLLGIEGSTQN